MKVLLVGEYVWPWYQEACASALESLGVDVVRFGWFGRFRRWHVGQSEPAYRSLLHRLQYGFLYGPIVRRLNRELVESALTERPDVVWFYNVQIIHASTVRKLRELLPRATLCQYANDNPFSPLARTSMWRHFIKAIPLMDAHHAYRRQNIEDFMSQGARQVDLLRAYFVPWLDFPVDPDDIDVRFRRDVVFAGHYEPDGRVAALEAICRAGHSLSLFGGGWDAALTELTSDSPLRALYPIRPATGLDYNRAICGAKVALCFLSTLNQDTYTRRSFQIPAMKSVMLSQRSDDLSLVLEDGKEVVLFSTPVELLQKLEWLLQDGEARKRIAEAAYARVYRDGHDVRSRMQQWLSNLPSKDARTT